MKKLNITSVLFCTLLLFVTGCGEDFFDRPPRDQLTEENFYRTADDLARSTAPLYNVVWFDFNDKAKMEIGDVRAGNMLTNDGGRIQFLLFSTTSDNMRLNELWRSLYLVIAKSNMTMNNIATKASGEIAEEVKQHRIAEARFMRGVAYSYLAQLWGDVPIITNAEDLIENPNVRRNHREDVLEFAIRDFKFAAEHLVLNDAPGRVTEWSAKGMLARMYLTRAHYNSSGGSLVQSDLDLAREYALDVIQNSGAQLMDNYADLFKRENNRNPETLFALQWTLDGEMWGRANSTQAYYAPEGRLTGVGDGWGGGTGVSTFVMDLFGGPDSEDARRKPSFMINGDHYPELLQAQGGYTYELQFSAIKKYLIGRPEDNDGQVDFMATDIQTYMLRLAEVYLIYAQAVLGNNASTNDGLALQYFNAVRERAELDAVSSITHRDILEEKWKELIFEGQNWYELVRYFNWRPSDAMEYINNQNRNASFTYSQTGGYEVTDPPAAITVSDSDFRLLYPEADMSANPELMREPVAYDFD